MEQNYQRGLQEARRYQADTKKLAALLAEAKKYNNLKHCLDCIFCGLGKPQDWINGLYDGIKTQERE